MARDNVIHLACALNDSYLTPTGVMLVSMFENNKSRKFHVHVFSGDLNEKSIRALEDVAKRYNAEYTFYPLDDSKFQNLAFSDRLSSVTYYRDVIPETINPDVEKILYLDGDMIVVGDISPLWNTNLDNYILAAVDDLNAIKSKEFDRLKIPQKYGYFNSGTWLINRREWVKNNTSYKIFSYTRANKEILKYLDQDAENVILHERRKTLDLKWNQQVCLYLNHSGFDIPDYTQKQLDDAKYHPVIVHFNGIEKPWHHVNLHPYKKDYLNYQKTSGLPLIPENITLKKRLKKVIYRIFGWAWWNRE